MKWLFNLILAGLIIVMLSACGKQAETESSVDKEQYRQTESAETTERTQEGDSTVTEDIAFNFETKTVLLNSGYEMPIYGIGTYSLTGDTCVESVTTALNCGVRLIDTAYMYHNEGEHLWGEDVTIIHDSSDDTTKIWIWDFVAENGDHVQVLVDGVVLGMLL